MAYISQGGTVVPTSYRTGGPPPTTLPANPNPPALPPAQTQSDTGASSSTSASPFFDPGSTEFWLLVAAGVGLLILAVALIHRRG